MAWFGLAKMALQAGSHIYKKRQETKIDQNEELAELRADTSIEKQEMANATRLKVAGMKPKTNGRSKQ